MNFNIAELVDMTFGLGESDINCLLANRIYKQRYSERKIPDISRFQHLLDKSVDTVNVEYKKSERIKCVVNEDISFLW